MDKGYRRKMKYTEDKKSERNQIVIKFTPTFELESMDKILPHEHRTDNVPVTS